MLNSFLLNRATCNEYPSVLPMYELISLTSEASDGILELVSTRFDGIITLTSEAMVNRDGL